MRRGSISSELLMCGGGVRSILLFPHVARCLETRDVMRLQCKKIAHITSRDRTQLLSRRPTPYFTNKCDSLMMGNSGDSDLCGGLCGNVCCVSTVVKISRFLPALEC